MIDDRRLLKKAFINEEYALTNYLDGRNKEITWDTKLGEFLVYSGLVYRRHERGGVTKMPFAESFLLMRLYALRINYGETPRAVRLGDLKKLMAEERAKIPESGKCVIHPANWDKRITNYLNELLEGYGLEPITNSESQLRNKRLESIVTKRKVS